MSCYSRHKRLKRAGLIAEPADRGPKEKISLDAIEIPDKLHTIARTSVVVKRDFEEAIVALTVMEIR